MLLNSFSFLAFFGVVAAVYYMLAPRLRWLLVLFASYYFYSAFEPLYTLLLAYATLVAYVFGRLVAGGKARGGTKGLLILGVLAELGVLALFKYADFLLGSVEGALAPLIAARDTLALPRLEWLLPAGLSFFTFSCVSYIVDCYRGTLEPERHLGRLAVYVAFFPKLVAGPIERAGDFLPQLRMGARFDRLLMIGGLQLLLWGLFKKVVIADRLAEFVDAGFVNTAFQSPVTVLISVYLYAFQIYCDFSGYSDMAIGMAAILGFSLKANFLRPYLSPNPAEFWSARWHISLARWFRDYLYIPLGGSRVAPWRAYLNVMIVFAVSGLWHGAAWTFVAWGLLNGAYQVGWQLIAPIRAVLNRALPALAMRIVGIVVTFHLVAFAWIFFRADSFAGAQAVITRIWSNLGQFPLLVANYNWTWELWLAFGLIGFLVIVECFDEIRSLWTRLAAAPLALRWGVYYALLASLVLIGSWGGAEFVYMQF